MFPEWLPIKEPDFYRDGNFKTLPQEECASSGIVSKI